MTITGLTNNNYLINNKITLLINGFASDVRYLELTFTNSTTTKSGRLRLYPINNTFKIDIAKIVKSTFNEPLFNFTNDVNICTVVIDFKATVSDNTTSTTTVSNTTAVK